MTGAAATPAPDGVAAIARRHDPERYLACLFAPADRRDALLAVLAVNHEIAKTAEVVSEPAIGQIRLQWWREAFDGIEAGTPRAHEVVRPLADAVRRQALDLGPLRAIVDAREADLGGEPPADLAALDAYAAATAGELHALLAGIIGADPAAARDAGTAWGLIGLARAAPVLIAAGRTPLPRALLEESGISHQKIRDMSGSVDLGSVLRPVVVQAHRRLAAARAAGDYRAAAFRPLRLLADRALDHAGRLERAGFVPAAAAAGDPAGLVWRYAARFLRYRLGL